MSASAFWPEIPEAEAPDEIAALYAGIRSVTGMPAVNLVYRALAAIPGALRPIWCFLGPLYEQGAAADFARDIQRHAALPDLPQLPTSALLAVGLTDKDLREIADVVDFYVAGNSMNLFAMSVLCRALDGKNSNLRMPIGSESARRSVSSGPIRPLLPMETLSEETRALVILLNRLGEGSEPDWVAPSLFRHLAHWPAFLGLAAVHLLPADRDGSLTRSARAVKAHALERAAALTHAMPPYPLAELAAAPAAQALAIAQHFASITIARLLPICLLLRSTLPKSR